MTRQPRVRVARVYDDLRAEDGHRVLVDRVWPRGLSKDRARIDEWCKEIAPSTALRKWYRHAPQRFSEFDRRYRTELGDPERARALTHLRELGKVGPLTLVTATKDTTISQAAVLLDALRPQRHAKP